MQRERPARLDVFETIYQIALVSIRRAFRGKRLLLALALVALPFLLSTTVMVQAPLRSAPPSGQAPNRADRRLRPVHASGHHLSHWLPLLQHRFRRSKKRDFVHLLELPIKQIGQLFQLKSRYNHSHRLPSQYRYQ